MSDKVNRIFEIVDTNPKQYSITLTGGLGPAEDYLEELQLIRELKEGETVHLNINGYGGQVATLVQFVNVINGTAGIVQGNLEGMAHSCHSMLFLACHSWTVGSNCIMLVHNYSAGDYGKGAELKASVDAKHNWCGSIAKDIYEGFLTEDELATVLDDKDIWINSEELVPRLNNLAEHRQMMYEIQVEAETAEANAEAEKKTEEMYAQAKQFIKEYEGNEESV